MDWISVLLAVLLTATLVAYFLGVTPYPLGWLVLGLLLYLRIDRLRRK